MSRHTELAATIGAGTVGAVAAVLVIGASLVFTLPAVAVVTVIAWLASRRRTD